MESNPYRFIKVEDYFRNYQQWSKLEKVTNWSYDDDPKSATFRTVSLHFEQGNCILLIQFLGPHTFRVRFHPGKHKKEEYPANNTRAVVLDTLVELYKVIEDKHFDVKCTATQSLLEVTTQWKDSIFIRLKIQMAPLFSIAAYKFDSTKVEEAVTLDKDLKPYWETACPSIYYKATTNDGEYNIIQAVKHPHTAKYIGFGEQGGKSLFKHTCQLNYFNFDNMCYKQVYNKGPFEEREPLYHSDISFIGFNPICGYKQIYGVFVDNPSQVFVDLVYSNSCCYLIGTRFGYLDYYITVGSSVAEITTYYARLIGTPRLKPRYVLGYHQGCYGYETRSDLERVVMKYRQFQIPLDGLHVDVDIQYHYQTFTIDENKFPNPKEMFENLRKFGIKCSTNITPIISNRDPNYKVYREGIEKDYFIKDIRVTNGDPRINQDFTNGYEIKPNDVSTGDNYNSGRPYIGEVYYGDDNGIPRGTTGHYPDFGRKEVRQWWGKQYQNLFDVGLEMIWQDMTTPAIRSIRGDMRGFPFRLKLTDDYIWKDNSPQTEAIKIWNLYSYNLHKATFHGLNNLEGRKEKRNFIIGRGSLSGMHRFAGLWTGDNCSSWSFFQMNISQVLALGICGISICGQDIGGFEANSDWEKWADPELLIRWTIAGAFLPWFRNHYNHKGNRKYFQEPWAYQDQNHLGDIYRYVLPICKYYIELRYRLLQLFYDAMFENVINGLPICRAMVINENNDEALFSDKSSFLDNQFFVRQDLLVAPILYPHSDCGGKRDIYLPCGSDWYLFMNNRRSLANKIQGGTTICFDATINDQPDHIPFIVPIFVRAGAIIPTIELEQYVGERNINKQPNPITFNIYPGKEGSYITYLDDGISSKSGPKNIYRDSKRDATCDEADRADDKYRAVKIHHKLQNHVRIITIERIFNQYTPQFEKYFFIAILHDLTESNEKLNPLKYIQIQHGQNTSVDIPCQLIPDGNEREAQLLNESTANAWYFNRNINITFIKVFDEPNVNFIQILAHYKNELFM